MVGRRILSAAVGAWVALFVAVPALAAGPRAGSASAAAVNVRVSPLAVVPASVFAQLTSLTGQQLDSSVGNASLQVDYTNVKGSLGSLNVYGNSEAQSEPVVANVAAVASLMNILQNELSSIGAGSAIPTLTGTLDQLEAALGPALGQYLDIAKQLATQGHFAVPSLDVKYPECAGSCSAQGSVIPAVGDPTGLVYQAQALAPYTATASDGDTSARHNVEATSSVDALGLLNSPAIPVNVNATALAQLQGLINALEAALPPAVASQLQGTPAANVGGLLGGLNGTVSSVGGTASSVIPAGTPIASVTALLTKLLDLQAALNGLNTSLDLSQLVATTGVASDVSTSVTNGAVHSIATTKAASVKILTLNAPQLTSLLGGSQGNALAVITGATASAETTADGRDSHATGTGEFTDIDLLPGTSLEQHITWAKLMQTAGCGVGRECVVTAGPLQVVIDTGVCACTDAHTNGGTADAASATVSALEIKINYLGGASSLLSGVPALTASAPATLADVQLATATANSGQAVSPVLPGTGSPYGVGLLVGFLLLVAAAGMGVTYRRLAAVKAGRS